MIVAQGAQFTNDIAVFQYRWPRYEPEAPVDTENDCASAGDLCKKLRILAKARDSNRLIELEFVAKHIALHASELDPYAIANVFQSCKMGGYLDQSLITALVNRIVDGNLFNQFDSIQIGMSIHSLGVLSRNLARVSGAGLGIESKLACIILASELCEKEVANEQVVSNVVYGLGNLFRIGKGQRMKQALVECMEGISAEVCRSERLHKYTEQALSNIIYGWALMGWKSKDNIQTICEEIVQSARLRNYSEQELCNVIYGLGQLEYFDEESVLGLSMEVIAPHRLRKFSHKELCLVIHGIAQCVTTCGRSDVKIGLVPVVRKLAKEARQANRLKQYNVTDLAMLICGFGVLDSDGNDTLTSYFTRFVKMNRSSAGLQKEDLTKVLLTCVRSNHKHQGFLDLVEEQIAFNRIDLNSSFTITLVLWCLAKLNHLKSGTFLKLCRQLVQLKHNGEKLSLQSCVQLSQVVMQMGVHKGSIVVDEDLSSLFTEAMGRQKTEGPAFRDLLVQATAHL